MKTLAGVLCFLVVVSGGIVAASDDPFTEEALRVCELIENSATYDRIVASQSEYWNKVYGHDIGKLSLRVSLNSKWGPLSFDSDFWWCTVTTPEGNPDVPTSVWVATFAVDPTNWQIYLYSRAEGDIFPVD